MKIKMMNYIKGTEKRNRIVRCEYPRVGVRGGKSDDHNYFKEGYEENAHHNNGHSAVTQVVRGNKVAHATTCCGSSLVKRSNRSKCGVM